MSCAQVAGLTTAGLVAMRSSCPRNPTGTPTSKPRKPAANDGYGAEVTNPGPHDVLLGRGGGTNNHCGNINFRKLVNEHKMRYLACSKIEKPNVAREVVELWKKMDPPGRFLARKEDTEKGSKKNKDGGSDRASNGDVIWIEVPEKKAREKASQCLRERTPDVVPYIRQLREQQDQVTEQGVSMIQQQLQMQREAEAQQNSLHGMGGAAVADYQSSLGLAEHNPYQNPMAGGPMAGGYGDRRTSMPLASNVGSGMEHQMQHRSPFFNRRQSAPHLSSSSHHSDCGNMNPNAAAMMGQMHGQYGGGMMIDPGYCGSGGDTYDPAFASSMTAMQLQQHHQQMQMQQMQLQQQQLQLQMQQQHMHQQAAHIMPLNGYEQNWSMQQVNWASGMPNHLGHCLNHSGHAHAAGVMHMNNDSSCSSQRARIPDAPKSDGHMDPPPVPAPDQSTSGNFNNADQQQTQSPGKGQKERTKVLSNHDRTPKQPKQLSKKVTESNKATPKAADPPAAKAAPEKTPKAPPRTAAAPVPAVSPDDVDAPLPLHDPEDDEDDHGEVTLEEYRKTLESYMANNNITAQNPGYHSEDDDLSVESFPEWPDEADRRHERPEEDVQRATKKPTGARAPPMIRNVNRHKSGQSMMSCNTFKSNATSLSGLSMLSDMMSMESGGQGKAKDRRFSSASSIMSELTDISHTIDGLDLDDDC